jgi:hypothetical protein
VELTGEAHAFGLGEFGCDLFSSIGFHDRAESIYVPDKVEVLLR